MKRKAPRKKVRKERILGTVYTIEKKTFQDEPIFDRRHIDGYCDGHLKKIVYCDMRTHPGLSEESDRYCRSCEKATLRHEIIHAFLDESGLMQSSGRFERGWSQNEEMVDWLALQSPKIFGLFVKLDIL